MLLDLLQALATPAPLAHRRLGCVGDSVRTGSRARRCRRAWAPHLFATQDMVRTAIAGTAGRETAVVLGSGRLDDVPLAEHAAAFRRVVLVDAVHPLRARMLARRHRNVVMITADLSGSFALLLSRSLDLESPLPPVRLAPSTDLVVSVNLLSQLPIRPVERLESSPHGLGRWRPEDGETLGRSIVSRHLKAASVSSPTSTRSRRTGRAASSTGSICSTAPL